MDGKTYDFHSLKISAGRTFSSAIANGRQRIRTDATAAIPAIECKDDPLAIMNTLFQNQQYKIIPKAPTPKDAVLSRHRKIETANSMYCTLSAHQRMPSYKSNCRPLTKLKKLYSERKTRTSQAKFVFGILPSQKCTSNNPVYANRVNKMYEKFMNIQKMKMITKYVNINEINKFGTNSRSGWHLSAEPTIMIRSNTANHGVANPTISSFQAAKGSSIALMRTKENLKYNSDHGQMFKQQLQNILEQTKSSTLLRTNNLLT